jgi:alkanesulfonate monooxygenase SsuD/methylene tetrahydromethanopterin reductase-like flavin-dependent oxidoreductase (luciferase family)
MLRLSVLDQSTVVTGRSPDTSIRESLALAKHCEALGYTRYWCAEHHNSASQAGTAPEILISAIAATTTRIRVGSAGVMLPFAVGTPLSRRPPHRSVRAEFPHTAPTSGV